jgi:hypothetical protein
MEYLTRLANVVGYESEGVIGKAFKRVLGTLRDC